jgi:hypothetical protein
MVRVIRWLPIVLYIARLIAYAIFGVSELPEVMIYGQIAVGLCLLGFAGESAERLFS